MSARDETDDTFELYDLRVEVVATDRPMVCGHRAGDWLELSGENLTLPEGRPFSIYALAALLLFLARGGWFLGPFLLVYVCGLLYLGLNDLRDQRDVG